MYKIETISIRDSKNRLSTLEWVKYYGGLDWWRPENRKFWEKCLMDGYNDWLDLRKDTWIVCSRFNDDELEDEIAFIPWSCRQSAYYKKLLNYRLRSLFGQNDKLAVHLMLSTDPHKFQNIYHAMKGLKKSWGLLHDLLVKKHGLFKYIAVPEISPENHLPHLHVLIFGVPWLDDVRHLSKLWSKYGQGAYVHIKRRDYNRGLKEVLKYLYKNVDDDFLGAILWVTRSRSYMCNNGLFRPLVLHDPGTWMFPGYSYLGLVHGHLVQDLIRLCRDDEALSQFNDGLDFKIKDPPLDWEKVLNLVDAY